MGSSSMLVAQKDTVIVINDSSESSSLIIDLSNGESKSDYIKRYYRSRGYLEIDVKESNSDTFMISNMDQYRIGEFIFVVEEGSDPLQIPNLVGEVYQESAINEFLEEEYQRYIDEGYRNVQIRVSELKIDSAVNTVNIEVHINTGGLVYLSGILFNGNSLNSPDYLGKISGMRDSMVASENNLQFLRRNLIGSELLEEVSDPVILTKDDQEVVLFNVQERNLNRLDGLIGYVPDQNGDGRIVGDLNISLWNLFSQGNSFELLYQRLKPETSRLNLGVSQNWIGGIPLRLGLDFNFYQNDTTYQTRDLKLSSTYQVSPGFGLIGSVFNSKSISGSGNNRLEPDGSKQGSELGFEYQNTDRFEVPTKGIKFKIMYGVANKDIETDSSSAFRQQNLNGHAEIYFPIFDRSVIATRLRGFYTIGEEFTESDLIRFGGANSLRGYGEEQFVASEMVWGDLEYRFLTDRNSYLFVFGASGYYHRPQLFSEEDNTFVQGDLLYSGGFGISYKTQIGRLTFSYAISSTETIGNGKVHFGIRTGL